MDMSRRLFLKSGTTAALGSGIVNSLLPINSVNTSSNATEVRNMITHALDVAKSSGAQYADARLTHSFERQYPHPKQVLDSESITVGVRCLLNGYWGFASGPVWSKAAIEGLAREAAAQARINSLGKVRDCNLAAITPVKDESWITPIEIDPFSIHPTEVHDLIMGLSEYAKRHKYGHGVNLKLQFQKQNKVFGSTDGGYFSQTTYNSGGSGHVNYKDSKDSKKRQPRILWFSGLSRAGVGFEILNEKNLREQVDVLLEEHREEFQLPVIPIDVGRYDTMFSAAVVSAIVSMTIGSATEIDRVLGYEANAGGTSYINDPDENLGSFVVGNSLLNVSGNRSMARGVATVGWDDEGVSPKDFTLVQEGVLSDFQTSRESAEWLRKKYEKRSSDVLSNGCAHASAGVDAPLVRCANLVMKSGPDGQTEDTLRQSIDNGLEVQVGSVEMDFQQLNGWLNAVQCYEIKGGKRTSRVVGAGALFKTPELWKSLMHIGGESSSEMFGIMTKKGQPSQTAIHSVKAVPIICEKVSAIDIMRKA